MRHLLYLITGLIVAISAAQSIGDLTKVPCYLNDCSVLDIAPNTEFGYITVPENYNNPSSRNLEIAYVILKTEHTEFKDDPVLIFQGGWGLPMTDLAKQYLRMPLLQERDVILYDYRGTGFSTRLPCQDLGKEAWVDLMDDLTIDEFYENQTQRYAACINTMENDGIEFNEYGMNNIARDAAFLAQQLPYDTYNLFGVSYGTMAIQHFMRAAALYDVTVRSAILDSSVPIGIPTQGTMPVYYKKTLLQVLNDCERDEACNKKFPNLQSRYATFLETLNDTPIRFTMEGGDPAYINKEEMNAIVHQLLYNQRVYPNIPLLLERIMQHDTEVILKMIPTMRDKVETSYNATGLVEYVYDHKASIGLSKQNLANNKKSIEGFELVDSYLPYYYEDTKIKLDSIANQPIQSEVPTLLLSGSYDPVTPPEWTKSLQGNFSTNYYFNLDKVGHGAAYHPCGTVILKQFINNPAERPSATCVEDLTTTPIAFVTDYHNNSKSNSLATDVLQMKNTLVLVLAAFAGVILLLNVFVGIFKFFKKRSSKLVFWRTAASLSGIVTLGSALYFISQAVNANGFLLVFGLPNNANWAFIATILFGIAGFMYISKLVTQKNFSIWNLASLLSFIVLAAGIIVYRLYPSFA